MKFEYDPLKSANNKEKHGINFEQIKNLWLVPHVELQAKTVDEPRYMIIGEVHGKFYSCIYTIRGNHSINLCSTQSNQ